MANLSLESGSSPKRPVDLSTADHDDRKKISFWQDVISKYLSPSISSQLFPERPFDGRMRCVVLGEIGVAQLYGDPLRNIRDAQCIRRQPDEDYYVAVTLNPNSRLRQNQRIASLTSGDVVVYGSSTPFEWESPGGSNAIIARFTRRQIISRIPQIDRLTARVIKADHPLGSIIGNTIREIVRLQEDNLDDSAAKRLGAVITDLVTSSIEASLSPRDKDLLTEDLLGQVKSLLLDNLDNPECDLNFVTQKLGISIRTIFRIFAADETTPMRWFWKQRLAMAFRLLSEAKVQTVSQAVMQSGFNDFAHFSRSFRKEYGATPLSILRKSL